MPLTSVSVGLTGPNRSEVLEDRWVMNYAASVLDRNPVYFDTTNPRGLPAHPAYVSHQEWDAITALYELMGSLTPEEHELGVHSFNDTHLIRPLRSGDEITCVARVQAVKRRRSGGQLTIRVDTTDDFGQPVARSLTNIVFRGVDVVGPDTGEAAGDRRGGSSGSPTRVQPLEIDHLAPHIFSECARDYNPIHTDVKAAARAGLPGLILHGTGTFAMALTSLTNYECAGDPTKVRRFGGRLGAMLLCPSTARLEVYANTADPDSYRFEVITEDGGRAIADGFVELAG